MTNFFSRPLTYIALLVFIILGGWAYYLPAKIAQTLKFTVQQQIGRDITFRSSGYSFSPQFGIAIRNVSVAGSDRLSNAVISAETVLVPVGFFQLFTGRSSAETMLIDGADIRVSLDGVGHTNVFEGESPKLITPMHLKLSNSRLHYFDERSGDQFGVEQISGVADFDSEGGITSAGSAAIKGQFVKFDANLASLERIFSDGSPFDLSVEGVATMFSFSGRLATAKRLNLVGQAEVISTDAVGLFKWLGASVPDLSGIQNLTLKGAIDSDGPVLMLKAADLKLGTMTAKGDISFSNAAERPNITAALGFDHLDLNLIRPVTDANWSDTAIDFSGLNAADVQFRLSANALEYGSLKTGAATVEGALQNRVLKAVIKSQDLAGGSGEFVVGLDATQLPPKLNLDVSLVKVAAMPGLSALINHSFLSGGLSLDSHFAATGNSHSEMMSTLRGDATIAIAGGTISGVTLKTIAAQSGMSWNGGQTSNLNGQMKFTINEGVATLGENQLDGEGFSLHSEGEIDLLRKSLDIVTGPVVKVKIQGLWHKPTLTPQ